MRWFGRGLLAMVLLGVGGCSDSTQPEKAAVSVHLTAGGFSDDRTYSVGRVQLRALDADDELLALQIFAINRATGVIDVVFPVPAGIERRILVEPLGSGILPNGGKTESGVAMQGMSERFDMEAGATVELEVPLLPFIPDNLRLESTQGGTGAALNWTPMPTAETHVVRVISFVEGATELVSRTVPVARPPVPLSELQGNPQEDVVGWQVQSVNRFSASAFSDTLFSGAGR